MIANNQFAEGLDLKVTLEVCRSGRQIPLGEKLMDGPIDIVLSYFGSEDEVYDFLQKASHRTRAYLVRKDGLKNLLVCGIIATLRAAKESEQLKEATKFQIVDMESILIELKNMKTKQMRFEFLQVEYPCLCIYMLKKRGMKKALSDYMAYCKSFEDPNMYSLQVHGYIIPYLQELRESGKLTNGQYL